MSLIHPKDGRFMRYGRKKTTVNYQMESTKTNKLLTLCRILTRSLYIDSGLANGMYGNVRSTRAAKHVQKKGPSHFSQLRRSRAPSIRQRKSHPRLNEALNISVQFE